MLLAPERGVRSDPLPVARPVAWCLPQAATSVAACPGGVHKAVRRGQCLDGRPSHRRSTGHRTSSLARLPCELQWLRNRIPRWPLSDEIPGRDLELGAAAARRSKRRRLTPPLPVRAPLSQLTPWPRLPRPGRSWIPVSAGAIRLPHIEPGSGRQVMLHLASGAKVQRFVCHEAGDRCSALGTMGKCGNPGAARRCEQKTDMCAPRSNKKPAATSAGS